MPAVNFNRTNQRDYVPCAREWEEHGRDIMMVVRTASSGKCMRSIVVRNGGDVTAMYHHVTEAGQTISATVVWRELALQAGVTPPSLKDPNQHIHLR